MGCRSPVVDAVGFILLLLAVFQSKIVKICVKKSNGPPSAATSHLRHLLAKEATAMGYCASNGDGIEECRKLCGGHGYLVSSGLPELFAVYIPACTYEGDNVVLLLQSNHWVPGLKSV
ncbi:hypothetical protein L1887_01453 [Cichorium endivia]|nr:hypothetical protein L1887_01453 [Cichorium endivia]